MASYHTQCLIVLLAHREGFQNISALRFRGAGTEKACVRDWERYVHILMLFFVAAYQKSNLNRNTMSSNLLGEFPSKKKKWDLSFNQPPVWMHAIFKVFVHGIASVSSMDGYIAQKSS